MKLITNTCQCASLTKQFHLKDCNALQLWAWQKVMAVYQQVTLCGLTDLQTCISSSPMFILSTDYLYHYLNKLPRQTNTMHNTSNKRMHRTHQRVNLSGYYEKP